MPVACSPRERRWAVELRRSAPHVLVLSARAEVGRTQRPQWRCTSSALRASGGGPRRSSASRRARPCSPRERRWAADDADQGHADGVLSARAEVGRSAASGRDRRSSALRASGGGPSAELDLPTVRVCSPRERRWAVAGQCLGGEERVLSARAEVGRRPRERAARCRGALRASGGGPPRLSITGCPLRCSPRERRWAATCSDAVAGPPVLSARAEVGRSARADTAPRSSALRASGGGPPSSPATRRRWPCSPRERRWAVAAPRPGVLPAVLSARAEVGRRETWRGPRTGRALRASGGGPSARSAFEWYGKCSPRERRWAGVRRCGRSSR